MKNDQLCSSSMMTRACVDRYLGTAEHTVKIHRGHVMEKMNADSLPALIRMVDTLKV